MSNVLLVEPDYRSKFPPLGLLRLSSYHKAIGDSVTFVRGLDPALKDAFWHRVYVASLFTWELPRTVRTVKYYLESAPSPDCVYVGGIAATLMPNYIHERVGCHVVEGALDRRGCLGRGTPPLAEYLPDYGLLDTASRRYEPSDAYFCRTTRGCIRQCKFCAVTTLEPRFANVTNWRSQVSDVRQVFGERQHLVLLDNNVLGTPRFARIVAEIRNEGFGKGALRNGRKRAVDFNQGIDARLIDKDTAGLLSTIPLFPVRLAFDSDAVEKPYRRAVTLLAQVGFVRFTNYLMFNFKDNPASLFRRMRINLELSESLGIQITGFPMRFIPTDDVNRRYVSSGWTWRYLRGMQCVLLATRGLVSPNPEFFAAAFGATLDEFLEILSMPDRYIIHREKHKDNGTQDWRKRFRRLGQSSRMEFLEVLRKLNRSKDKRAEVRAHKRYAGLLEHYYPHGQVPRE